MKYLSYLVVVAGMAFLATACKGSKLGPQETQEAQIRFGAGGGFTGAVTTYALLPNGKLYENDSFTSDTFALVLEIPRAEARAWISKLKAEGLDTARYSSYGTYYHFLEWREGGDTNRITWGRDDPKADPTWWDHYRALKQLTTPAE